jgi:glyoxylase-like metal-dependent hydrolase (beta-lactamase superfamily II)
VLVRSLVLVALFACVAAGDIRADTALTSPHFRVDRLAPGVYAVIQSDPLGLANHSNAVFIVGNDDVIVVDSQFTLQRTREVLAAVRKITGKPVSTLINTHWHDDHIFGNQVYREAYLRLEIIAQFNTKTDMATTGVDNRERQVAGGPDAVAMFRDAIAKKTAIDGTPMSDDERAAYESTIAIAQEYLGEMFEFRLTLPTRTFNDELTLRHDGRIVEIRALGPGVTRGDAVVWLLKERILVAGDLVDNPIPFAYACDVGGWIAALDAIQALKPNVIVPGHGEVLRGLQEVRRLRDVLASIQEQAKMAVARGESIDKAHADVNVVSYKSAMAGDNRMLQFLFDGFFVGPVMRSVFKEASEGK